MPHRVRDTFSLSRGLGAAGAGVGGAQQSVRRHRDGIGGGLAERFADRMAHGFQRRERVIGKAALDAHFVGQPLVMQPGRGDRGSDVHVDSPAR